MKTKSVKKSEVKQNWHFFDANNQVLGRMSTQIAVILMGKDKPTYTPNVDSGDYVVVTNAAKVKLTGDKENYKKYYHHSGYPGGFKQIVVKDQRLADPTKIISHAVKGMLPPNHLLAGRMKRLKIFADEKHPYGDKVKSQK